MCGEERGDPNPPPVDPDAMPKCPTTGVQKVKEEVSDALLRLRHRLRLRLRFRLRLTSPGPRSQRT
tara:strand:- start:85 stop:282 length:198 start_codon:yes stop_codon:yes gene_type:complete